MTAPTPLVVDFVQANAHVGHIARNLEVALEKLETALREHCYP